MSTNQEFTQALKDAMHESASIGYTPTRMIEMLQTNDGVALAKKLVVKSDLQSGLKEMVKLNRQDLTIESIMQKPQFQKLFTKHELAAAEFKLQQAKQ